MHINDKKQNPSKIGFLFWIIGKLFKIYCLQLVTTAAIVWIIKSRNKVAWKAKIKSLLLYQHSLLTGNRHKTCWLQGITPILETNTPQFNVVVAQNSSQRSRSCHISFECAENYIKFTVCLMHENTTKK